MSLMYTILAQKVCVLVNTNLGVKIRNRLCSIPLPLAGRHSNTQTNKPLNRDDWASQNCLVGGTERQTVT